MSVKFVCVVTVTMVGLSLYAAPVTCNKPSDPVPARAARIRAVTARIDRIPAGSRTIQRELVTGTDRGGSFTALVRRGRVQRIVVEVGLSNASVRQEFYYDSHGGLMLAIAAKQQYSWNSASGAFDFDKPKLTSKVEYHFAASKLFYVKYRLAQSPKGEVEEQKSGRQLLLDAIFFLTAARSISGKINIERQKTNNPQFPPYSVHIRQI